MSDQILINVPEIERLASNFEVIGETSQTIGKNILEGMNKLKKDIKGETWWNSKSSEKAYLQHLNWVQPRFESFKAKSEELSNDLRVSIQAMKDGDEAGGTRFH